MGTKQIDLVGCKFGRLTAILRLNSVSYKGSKKRKWMCVCECGTITEVLTESLKQGTTKSCGCLHNEKSKENSINSRYKIVNKDAGFNVIFGSYKSNAKKRGLSFELTKKEVKELFEGACNYCGLEPSNVYNKSYYNFIYSGIDRKDNTIGYTKDNCVSCCKTCNHAKATMDEHTFEVWLNRVFYHQMKGE